jgi:hypothetical protein
MSLLWFLFGIIFIIFVLYILDIYLKNRIENNLRSDTDSNDNILRFTNISNAPDKEPSVDEKFDSGYNSDDD